MHLLKLKIVELIIITVKVGVFFMFGRIYTSYAAI